MKLAFLILAHQYPNHLKKLVNKLLRSEATCFIHVDKKSNLDDFIINGSNIHFSEKRHAVYWGHFSMVDATLTLIKQALEHPISFDRFILISGTDYPIRPLESLQAFFRQNPDKEFINSIRMPADQAGKPISRLMDYQLKPTNSRLLHTMRLVLCWLRFIPKERDYRQFLGDMVPYGGSSWWALTRQACEHIVIFLKQHPKFLKFYKNTHMADEMIFQTILGNSQFKEHMHRNLTYTDWRGTGGSYPAWINTDHVNMFISGDVSPDDFDGVRKFFFARKFSDQAAHLVDQLDQAFHKNN